MSTVREAAYAQAASQYQETRQNSGVSKKNAEETSNKKRVTSGRTYGDPELSEAGLKYYNSLKEKFGGMNFVLVASDKKAEADAMKGSFATAGKMTVLIDEEKIERMATDEKYRRQVESTIANASSGVAQLQTKLSASGTKVKAFGMTVKKDGTGEFFAVIDKSLEKQRERIAQKRADKREEAKKAKREEAAKRAEDRLHGDDDDEDTVTITASSTEELLKKIQDYQYSVQSDSVMTEEEKQVGQGIDYSV